MGSAVPICPGTNHARGELLVCEIVGGGEVYRESTLPSVQGGGKKYRKKSCSRQGFLIILEVERSTRRGNREERRNGG